MGQGDPVLIPHGAPGIDECRKIALGREWLLLTRGVGAAGYFVAYPAATFGGSVAGTSKRATPILSSAMP
jgi:hypothetical protein